MSLTEIKASIDPACTKSPRLGDSPLYLYAAMLTRKFSQSYASRCSYRSVSPPAPASIIVDSPCRNDIAFHRFPLTDVFEPISYSGGTVSIFVSTKESDEIFFKNSTIYA